MALWKRTMPPTTRKRFVALFKCSSCEAISEDLKYSVSTSSTEFGTASPLITEEGELENYFETNSDDWGDTDWDGDPEYQCEDCEDTYSKEEVKERYKITELSEEDYQNYTAGRISKENIYEAKKKGKTTRPLITKIVKPDCGSLNMSIPFKSDVCANGFREFGTQCPSCGSILTRLLSEKEITCNECEFEFNISNLIPTMYDTDKVA